MSDHFQNKNTRLRTVLPLGRSSVHPRDRKCTAPEKRVVARLEVSLASGETNSTWQTTLRVICANPLRTRCVLNSQMREQSLTTTARDNCRVYEQSSDESKWPMCAAMLDSELPLPRDWKRVAFGKHVVTRLKVLPAKGGKNDIRLRTRCVLNSQMREQSLATTARDVCRACEQISDKDYAPHSNQRTH